MTQFQPQGNLHKTKTSKISKTVVRQKQPCYSQPRQLPLSKAKFIVGFHFRQSLSAFKVSIQCRHSKFENRNVRFQSRSCWYSFKFGFVPVDCFLNEVRNILRPLTKGRDQRSVNAKHILNNDLFYSQDLLKSLSKRSF